MVFESCREVPATRKDAFHQERVFRLSRRREEHKVRRLKADHHISIPLHFARIAHM
jgi:hypothetical protein